MVMTTASWADCDVPGTPVDGDVFSSVRSVGAGSSKVARADVDRHLLRRVPLDVLDDHRDERDRHDPEHEQCRAQQERSRPDSYARLAPRDGRHVRHRAHAPDLRRGQRPLLEIKCPDALDEDLLERRVRDLEAEDVVTPGDGRAEHGLRVGPGLDIELREVAARPRDADMRQRLEPCKLPAGGRGDPDDLVTGRVLDVPRRAGRHEPSVVDDRDRVAELLGHLELMRAEDDGLAPIAHLEEGGLEQGDIDRVESGERFVHQDHVGVVEHGGDELDLLLVALRERLRPSIGDIADPESAKPGDRVRAGPAPRDVIERREEHELVEDAHPSV